MYSEDSFIKDLTERFPSKSPRIIRAIGDDTSVTSQRPGRLLLATTDTLVEGTHFRTRHTTPSELGRKAVNVSVSDIAAMGGNPFFLLVSLGIPAGVSKKFLDELYGGIGEAAAAAGAHLAGGNTVRSPGRFFISTTMTGEVEQDRILYRSGASVGDTIYFTGTAGDAALGLKVLERDGRKRALAGPFRLSVTRHLDPEPRLEAGRRLASTGLATAMIDVSDGVMIDLGRLSAESSTGATVDAEAVPVSDELRRYAGGRGRRAASLQLALAGGEDYELLFTARAENAGRIAALSKRVGLPMTPIGKVVAKARGVTATGPGGAPLKLKTRGFEHF